MKVLLTGGTGFVGKHVLNELVKKYEVKLLARPGSEKKLTRKQREKCEIVSGDILYRKTVKRAAKGSDAVMNLVGIIREFPQKEITFDRLHVEATFNCVYAAQKEKAKFLQMSAIGAGPDAKSEYHRTKFRAEELVRASGLPYIIFRPTIIFSKGEGGLKMVDEMVQNKAVPMVGSGKYRWQPVHVKDVAKGMVKSLEEAEDEVIEMGGPEVYEFREIVDILAERHGRKVIKVPVPKWIVAIPTTFLQYHPWYPLSPDMLKMLGEDNIVEGKNFDGLNIKPKKLE